MILEVKNLSFAYANNQVLDDVSFQIESGQFVGVLGNNGTGKTTLIKCINNILKPKSGEIVINNMPSDQIKKGKIAQEIAYLSQQTELIPFSVFETILLGRKPFMKFSPTKNDIKIVEDIIQRMGLCDIAHKNLDELSGGQLQKVMIAKALSQEPKILLLDEPTNNLDIKSQHELLKEVKEFCKSGITVIAVLHDVNLALRYCDKFLFLKDKTIISSAVREDITEQLLKDVFDIDLCLIETLGQTQVLAK